MKPPKTFNLKTKYSEALSLHPIGVGEEASWTLELYRHSHNRNKNSKSDTRRGEGMILFFGHLAISFGLLAHREIDKLSGWSSKER